MREQPEASMSERHAFPRPAASGSGSTESAENAHDPSSAGSTGLIGMFGLGFLSAFLLGSEVTVNTTSYQTPGQGTSNNGEKYTLPPIPAALVGTEVVLTLRGTEEQERADKRQRIIGCTVP